MNVENIFQKIFKKQTNRVLMELSDTRKALDAFISKKEKKGKKVELVHQPP